MWLGLLAHFSHVVSAWSNTLVFAEQTTKSVHGPKLQCDNK